jgi:hypothetical protein
MRKMELGEHLYTFFHSQLMGKRGGDGFLGAGLAKKQVLYRHAWSFKLKNHYKSLLGPYEGKLQ